MAKTPNLNLNITPASESTKRFLDFRKELAGNDKESNMMILDEVVGNMKTKLTKAITWGMLKNGIDWTSDAEEAP